MAYKKAEIAYATRLAQALIMNARARNAEFAAEHVEDPTVVTESDYARAERTLTLRFLRMIRAGKQRRLADG